MNKNLIVVLVFVLIVLIFFWKMPDTKIDTIGNLLDKIITPICCTLSAIFGVSGGIKEYLKHKENISG
jgi:hypothetical protein